MYINMTKIVKDKAIEAGLDWPRYIDTYGQIDPKEIAAKDAAGFDLLQEVDNQNCHVGFTWQKREAN